MSAEVNEAPRHLFSVDFISSEKVDNRSSRQYGRKLNWRVRVPKEDDKFRYSHYHGFPFNPHVTVQEVLRGFLSGAGHSCKVSVSDCWKKDDEYEFYVSVLILASRPSEILSEEALVGEGGALVPHVPDLISETVADWWEEREDRFAHQQRKTEAENLCRQLVEEARKEAAQIVRLKQREEALRAEYEAESLVQVEKAVQQYETAFKRNGRVTYTDTGEPIDSRVVSAVIENAKKFLKCGSFMPIRGRGVDSIHLDDDDVE